MLVVILALSAQAGTLWTDTKRTMVVPTSRLSPAAREAHRAGSAKKETLLAAAVRAHPEDWSVLCVARAWRDGGAPIEAFQRLQKVQQRASHQRLISHPVGLRSRSLAEWWDHDSNGDKGFAAAWSMKLKDIKSAEEACLVLDAWYPALGTLPQMRTWATGAIQKFGDHPALLVWRARARRMTYIRAYPDSDPRSKNPEKVDMDSLGAVSDAKRALQLAPNDPGILIAAGSILMKEKNSGGPPALRRYAEVGDPWAERRARIKREYPAFFPSTRN